MAEQPFEATNERIAIPLSADACHPYILGQGRMMQQPAEKPIFWSGFLAVSLLLGTSYGFFLVEFAAVTHGYHWSSRFYIDPAITAIVCGGMVGLILGFVLDTTVSNPETRQKLAKSLWLLLIFSWFLFNLLLPGFSRARE